MSLSSQIAEALLDGDPGAWGDMATCPTVEVFEAALKRIETGMFNASLARAGFMAAAQDGVEALVEVFDPKRKGADYVALGLATSRKPAAVPVLAELLGDETFGTLAIAGLSRQRKHAFDAVAEALRSRRAAVRLHAVRVLGNWSVDDEWCELVLSALERERSVEVRESLEPLAEDARGEVSIRTIEALRRSVSMEEAEIVASHLQQSIYDGHGDFLPDPLRQDPAPGLVVAFDHLELIAEGTRSIMTTWWALADLFPDHPVKWWLAAGLLPRLKGDDLSHHLKRLDFAGAEAVSTVARRIREMDVDDEWTGIVTEWLVDMVTDDDIDRIAKGLGSTDSEVRERTVGILIAFGPPGAIAALEYLDHSRADHREAAARVVGAQPCRPVQKPLKRALEAERTDQVRSVLVEAWFATEDLHLETADRESDAWSQAFAADFALNWIDPENYPRLKWRGEPSADFTRWFYARLFSQNLRGRDPVVSMLVREMEPERRAELRRSLFGDGAGGIDESEAFACVVLSNEIELVACREWAESEDTRSESIAGARVRALASAGPMGLWLLQHWVERGRYRPHVDLAKEQLDRRGGIDALVREFPTLGWSDGASQPWSVGSRDGLTLVWRDGTLHVRNETGDLLKSVPRGRSGDDEEQVDRDLARLRAVREASTFVERTFRDALETWMLQADLLEPGPVRAWASHPLASGNATKVVFAEQRPGLQPRSLRLDAEGGFADLDERQQWPTGRLRVVHPADLSDEELETWTQIFGDYEIVQPISQLSRPVFRPSEAEKSASNLRRSGQEYSPDRIRWTARATGWDIPLDRGPWSSLVQRDWENLDVRAVIEFHPGFSVRPEDDEELQSLKKAWIGTDLDKLDQDLEWKIPFMDAPPLVFSEILLFLSKILVE